MWLSVVWFVVGLLVGGVIAFFISRKMLLKQLEKNPPINEKMIRAMFLSMGRKPSEAQIRQVINSMNQYK